MMQAPIRSLLCMLALVAAVPAQNDEAEFNQRQSKALNAFAKKVFEKGFPRQARIVWMKVHKLYDPDNAEAWTALGYAKVGSSWNPDPKRPYPQQDTGAGADGQSLQKQYEALGKDLANQHRAQAEKWAKAGNKARADKHWAMVLRWIDNDEQAQKALAHIEVGGVTGTELEKTLYDRSKLIEKTIEEQSKTDYEVKQVTVACQALDNAQVKYISVESEHFLLHGDPEELDHLLEALRWAERTLRVCQVAFPWQYAEGKWPQDWACMTAKETHQQILKANASSIPNIEFALEHNTSATIGKTEVTPANGVQTLYDSCVRNVAQGYSAFTTTGFHEGIGHTFVGQMFNNNRLFAIDRKKQEGTSASEEDREFQSPDYDVWKTLSLELAWKNTGGVPATKIPFCDASDMPNEERIKAWSFCDYMMRRDPELLRTMDNVGREMLKRGSKMADQLEEGFKEKHPDVTIAQLDKEWEDFWTGASPVMKAIQNNTPPLSAISKGVDKWLEAFNAARKAMHKTPVTWSANYSVRCKEHAEYLKKNKDLRSPADVHTEQVDLGGSYVGSLFAQMALVQIGASVGNAKKLFEKWVYLPGYRDALVNNAILSVGMYLEGDILVVNATSGIGTPKASDAGADCYPPRNDTGLIFDGEVAVEDLGPEAVALLEKHGRAGKKTIGFPLTLHFGSSGVGVRGSLTCSVAGPKGEPIEGVLVYDDGEVRTTSAPGMVTFWPLDPLKGKISFRWTWNAGDKQVQLQGAFSAK